MAGVAKNLLANAGDVRDLGSIPGSGRSPGGGQGNPLQYSCLESPMGRGAYVYIQVIRLYIHHTYTRTHMFSFFRFFSILLRGYCKILSTVQ